MRNISVAMVVVLLICVVFMSVNYAPLIILLCMR